MAKPLGMVLIFIACGLFAFSKVSALKQKLHNLAQMERALFLMKHEISFSGRELWEACDGLASALSGQVSELFFRIGDMLKKEETLSFKEGWDKFSFDLFSPEVQKVLDSFAATFGTLSKEVEEQAIDYCAKTLARMREEEITSYQKNRKLIYTLCFGAGAAIFILLI